MRGLKDNALPRSPKKKPDASASPKKPRGAEPERLSLHPLAFEDAVKKALSKSMPPSSGGLPARKKRSYSKSPKPPRESSAPDRALPRPKPGIGS